MIIWTVVDLFSKQAHFVPCNRLSSAQKLAKLFVSQVYHLHGVPWWIISGWGVQFITNLWKEFVRLIRSSQGFSSGFHSSTNEVAEEANVMVEGYLQCYVSYQQTNWAELLLFAEVAYNNTVHSSTGFNPFWVVHGMDFVPIPKCPQGTLSLCQSQEWINRIQGAWGTVKMALTKAVEVYKV